VPLVARRIVLVLLGVLLGVAGIYGIEKLLVSRDRADVAAERGPGQSFADQGHRHLFGARIPRVHHNSTPPTSGAHRPDPVLANGRPLSDNQLLQALEEGNVVLFYPGPRAPAALRGLADELAGPFDADLAASGQAVILAPRPGTRGITALAWRHRQVVDSPADPALRTFVSFWLGRGAG
jgi:hypothetical protein